MTSEGGEKGTLNNKERRLRIVITTKTREFGRGAPKGNTKNLIGKGKKRGRKERKEKKGRFT